MDETPGAVGNRRRRLLVDRPLQTSFLRSWLVAVALALVLEAVSLVLLGVIPVQADRPVTHSDIYWVLAGSAILLLGLAVILGCQAMLYTHRIAGAAYRIEKALDEMIESGRPQQILLRKGDYLGGIATRINRLVDRMGAGTSTRGPG